jgi:hypothetical protein
MSTDHNDITARRNGKEKSRDAYWEAFRRYLGGE